MLDQESDETFVRTERRAMNADRNLLGIIAVLVAKIKTARLGEIDLVGGDGKFTSDHAPGLHVDLRSVKGRFVRHFDIIDSRILQNVARHLFGLVSRAPVHRQIFGRASPDRASRSASDICRSRRA